LPTQRFRVDRFSPLSDGVAVSFADEHPVDAYAGPALSAESSGSVRYRDAPSFGTAMDKPFDFCARLHGLAVRYDMQIARPGGMTVTLVMRRVSGDRVLC
jgi:hypothetical protein